MRDPAGDAEVPVVKANRAHRAAAACLGEIGASMLA